MKFSPLKGQFGGPLKITTCILTNQFLNCSHPTAPALFPILAPAHTAQRVTCSIYSIATARGENADAHVNVRA